MTWKLRDFLSRSAQSTGEAGFERAKALISQGQWQSALEALRAAVSADPNHAEAHVYLGNVLRQLNQPEAARLAYDRAIAVNPTYVEAHYNRASTLHQLGQLMAALDSYAAALSVNPSFVEAHLRRGSLLLTLGQPATAEASYRHAIALRPDDAEAHAGLGLALMALSQLESAILSFDRAMELKPDFARALGNRAEAEAKLGRLESARSSYQRAVLLSANDAGLHFNQGVFLSDCKDWHGAIESYRTVIALEPDHAEAYCNLGLVEHETGQADAAMENYSRALAINPRLATAFNNRGNLFRSRKEFAQAMMDYEQAIALEPNFAEAHFNIGQLALLQGNFAAGWPEYEWRSRIREALTFPPRNFPQPAWDGKRPLRGRSILLHAEQGLGDTIQFCRYVSRVADLGARVSLEVQPSLADLLTGLDGVAQLVRYGEPPPPADYHCPLMSLPRILETTLDTIPRKTPYLRAEPHKVARWNEHLGPRTSPRIGLAWSGNPHLANDHNRSVPLARWIAHLPKGFDYICLQNEIRAADRQSLPSFGHITSVESQLKNFTDTAALLETLDLVISVDTSLAHLSGAMAKKTWILLPFLPDWRWLLDRADSPWYPTATLYRQPTAGDWDSVLSELGRNLVKTFSD